MVEIVYHVTPLLGPLKGSRSRVDPLTRTVNAAVVGAAFGHALSLSRPRYLRGVEAWVTLFAAISCFH